MRRTTALLRLLSRSSRRWGVVELARELDLPKPTVHGILRTLHAEGFVEQDPESRKYQAGPSLLPLGFAYLESNRLRTAALNAAQVLADRSGQSVRVGTLHDTEVLVIHHVRGRNDSQPALDFGCLVPLHATALGKALLTGAPELLTDLAVHDLRGFTPATITDPAALQREVDEARERGWAIAVGEILPGVASLAAPIRVAGGAVIGAIGVEFPARQCRDSEWPPEQLIGAVIDGAHSASRDAERLGV